MGDHRHSGRLSPDDASPAAVGAARLIVGGACLLVVVSARSGRRKQPPAAGARGWQDTAGIILAAAAMAAYQPLFFGGVARTGVAVGTVVGIGSAQVFAGVLGVVAKGERPGRRWLIATALALAGAALLVKRATGTTSTPWASPSPSGPGWPTPPTSWPPSWSSTGAGRPARSPPACSGWPAWRFGSRWRWPPGWGGWRRRAGWPWWPTWAWPRWPSPTSCSARACSAWGWRPPALTLAEPATAAVLGVVVVGERFGGATAAGLVLVGAGLVALVAGGGDRTPQSVP